jgi:serine/threonine protein kinase
VLFEMLTAQKPYSADNPMAIIYMHRNAPLPRLPDAIAELQPLLDRLLAKRPEDRFADADKTIEAIEAARSAWLLNATAARA